MAKKKEVKNERKKENVKNERKKEERKKERKKERQSCDQYSKSCVQCTKIIMRHCEL